MEKNVCNPVRSFARTNFVFCNYFYKLYFVVFGNIKIERRVDHIGIRAELIKRGIQKLRGTFSK
jgi:hypothetical protein